MSVRVKTFRFFIVLIFLIAFSNISAAADFSGNGAGTERDPFQITTLSQLDEVRYHLSANYILMNDLDFNDFSGDWTPLGFSSDSYNEDFESFTGVFDGNNKTIRNLTINQTGEEIGLFSCIESEGMVLNLNIENAKINGDRNVGTIAGLIRFSGSIINCHVINSTVTASDYCGVLTGNSLDAFIDSCSVIDSSVISSGAFSILGVTSYGHSGGLVSKNSAGIIRNCVIENTTIQSQSLAGGISSVNEGGIIENSSVIQCSIKSEASLADGYGCCGGIAGLNTFGGLIVNSSVVNSSVTLESSSMNKSFGSGAGGIAGQSSWEGKITDCQASGEVKSNMVGSDTGGIAGNASLNTTLLNCSSFSSVTALRFGNAGGIAGSVEHSYIENCSALNSEINQFETFSSIQENYSVFDFIYLKIKCNAGYITGDGSKSKINRCVYSDQIKSNKHIFIKSGSEKVIYVDDWTGLIE